MKCRECGNDILQSAQFCGNCGASIDYNFPEVNISHNTQVDFTTAIGLGFNRVFDFRGRSSRAEYWWWVLFSVLGDVILSIVDVAMGTYNAQSGSGLISTIFGFFILIPSIALGVRRLHDINKSGWWWFMDQFSLFMAYERYKDKLNFYTFNKNFMNFDNTVELIMYSAKGTNKESEDYKKLMQKYSF